MAEMKIRLHAEQQQKSRKSLFERDEYWQSKVSSPSFQSILLTDFCLFIPNLHAFVS
jgi:hypothetical protein